MKKISSKFSLTTSIQHQLEVVCNKIRQEKIKAYKFKERSKPIFIYRLYESM